MVALEVVAAAIVAGGRLLAAQRGGPGPLAGKWEFPGGKVEPGESDAQALARELVEELAAVMEVQGRIGPQIDIPGGVLRLYRCSLAPGAAPVAVEHADLRWVSAAEITELDWLEPDWPLVEHVRHLLTS